jgi:hypothetical protein
MSKALISSDDSLREEIQQWKQQRSKKAKE